MSNVHPYLLLPFFCLIGCAGPGEESLPPRVNLPDGAADSNAPIECPDGAPRLINGQPATWTLMYYAAGDNDLESGLLRDINEMELGHEGSPNVNVLVQLDRKEPDGVWRYEIQGDDLERDPDRSDIISRVVGYSEEEPDSGDHQTLLEFGRWATTCYPAEHYILLLGGHGRGWSSSMSEETVAFNSERESRTAEHGDVLRVLAPDDTDGSEMYVDELALTIDAIAEFTKRADDPEDRNRLLAYGSDACLMNTMEVVSDLSLAVRYVIGSEQTEPKEGWPYSTILRELTHRPSHYAENPEALFEEIVDAYGRSYADNRGASGIVRSNTTLAAIDTRTLPEATEEVALIALIVTELLDDPEQGSRLLAELTSARRTTPTFGHTFTDLGQLLLTLRGRLIDAGLMAETGDSSSDPRYDDLRYFIDSLLETTWPELVIAVRNGEDYPEAMGLSVFFPLDFCDSAVSFDHYSYSDFANATGWSNIVAAVLNQRIREAGGEGYLDISFEGQEFLTQRATCRVANNKVYFSISQGNPENPPLLNLTFSPSGAGLALTAAQIDARSINEFRAGARRINIEVEQPEVEQGVRYAGAVTIPFVGTDQNLDVNVQFLCDDVTVTCH